MSDEPVWEEVREDWLPNDGYRDVFIPDATDDDWRTLIAWIGSRSWETTYTEDSEITEMPDVLEVMSRHSTVSTLWAIDIGEGVTVHGYFWEGDTHFDLDPREIRGARQFARVCEFVRSVGEAVGKPVEVWAEGARGSGRDEGLVTAFDPTTGAWRQREGL